MSKQIILEPMDVVGYLQGIAKEDYRRIKTAGHLAESDDAQGGFLVPETFLDALYGFKTEESIVLPRCIIMPMASDSMKGPRTFEESRADGTMFGGISYSWEPEAGQLKTKVTKPKLGQLELVAKKLVALFWASNCLIDDSSSFKKFVKNTFMKGMSFILDDAFVNGTGVGSILGILNSNSLITVPRQTNNQICMTDLGRMLRRFPPESVQSKSSVWMMNQDVASELFEINAANANPAAHYVLNDRKLFGMPVYLTSTCPTLGVLGDVILADWSYYIVGRRDLTVASSSQQNVDNLGWLSDETLWRLSYRGDGMPIVDRPIIPRRGTRTISPFVALSTTSS